MSWPWESKAAVDGRFYAQHLTAFTVTRSNFSSRGGLKVTRFLGDNKDVMKVETAHLGNGNLRSFLLNDAVSNIPLLAVEESRFGAGAGQRRWEAFRGREMRGKDRLFLAVDKTQFFQMGNEVHVFLDDNSSGERVPDFVVRGSYFWSAMTVSRGGDDGELVAHIRNESSRWARLFGESKYTVVIKPGVDQAFVLALTVILDQMQIPPPHIPPVGQVRS